MLPTERFICRSEKKSQYHHCLLERWSLRTERKKQRQTHRDQKIETDQETEIVTEKQKDGVREREKKSWWEHTEKQTQRQRGKGGWGPHQLRRGNRCQLAW